MPEAEIRARIRRLIHGEELPCEADCDLWAGQGTNKKCSGCGEPIPASTIEFEVQLPGSKRIVFFHGSCHRIWEEECRAAGKA